MQRKKKLFIDIVSGALAVSLAAVLWGFDGIALTPKLNNLDAGFATFILHAIPFVAMQPFLFRSYKDLKNRTYKEIGGIFMVSFFGGALGTLCMVKALFLVNFNHLSAIVLLQKLQPVFAILLAAIFLKEKLHPRFALWALLAIIAGFFLTFGLNLPQIDQQKNMIQAALFALIAAFSFGASTVFSKYSLNKFSFTSATFFRYGFTTLILTFYLLVTSQFSWILHITPSNWGIILLISATTGSGAIFLYYYGLRKVSAMVSTILELFFPISAVVFDYFINGEKLSVIQFIAMIFMLLCVFMMNRDSAKKPI